MNVNNETNKKNQKNNPSIMIPMNLIGIMNPDDTASDVVKKQHIA